MRILSHVHRNLIAYLALFVALGGTSYAAVSLPKNSVGARQIKTNAVRTPEIKRNAVHSSEIARRAVGRSELRGNAVDSARIADASVTGADLAPGAIQGPVLGYAHVKPNGDVDEALSLNVTDAMVKNAAGGADGFFCIRNLPFRPRHVMASVEQVDGEAPGFATASITGDSSVCQPDDESAVVQTGTAFSPEGIDRPFFIIFLG